MCRFIRPEQVLILSRGQLGPAASPEAPAMALQSMQFTFSVSICELQAKMLTRDAR